MLLQQRQTTSEGPLDIVVLVVVVVVVECFGEGESPWSPPFKRPRKVPRHLGGRYSTYRRLVNAFLILGPYILGNPYMTLYCGGRGGYEISKICNKGSPQLNGELQTGCVIPRPWSRGQVHMTKPSANPSGAWLLICGGNK